MGVHKPIPTSSSSLIGFCVTLLLLVSSCYCENVHKSSSVQVVGVAKCSDCTQSNLLSTHALSGLRVTIYCKVSDKGEFKTRGVGELDKEGKFKVTLPSEIVKDDGALKEECFAQLHSASNKPCPTHQGLEASKLILKSKDEQTGKHTFSPTGEISISPITCTSAFLWPHFKFPPLPKFPPHPWFKKTHPWFKKPIPIFKNHPWFKKPIPKFKIPHLTFPPHPPKVFPPIYKHPILSPPVYKSPPMYEKPLPPPVPVFEPPPKVNPPPVYEKPLPPPVPVYKPPKITPPPEHKKKPCPPPVHKPTPKVNPPPVYEKPLPPPVPVYVPTPKVNPPPVYEKPLPPPVPIYKPSPPIYTKPLPPFHKIPPIFKKPYPPLPPLPHFPKIPPKFIHPFPKITKDKFLHHPIPKIPKKFIHPIPKIPKKFFHHPKFGKWPPMSPFSSNP